MLSNKLRLDRANILKTARGGRRIIFNVRME